MSTTAEHNQRRRGDLRGSLVNSHVTTLEDMPRYPAEMHAMVDAMMADLAQSTSLMTYRTIRQRFGISRATVARRLREGVVPGITLSDGHVLDDGPVRRFDPMQLRWLLLAVRFAHRRAGGDQRNTAPPR